MRIAVACLFAAVGSLAAAGCVNEYLYGEGEQGTSTTGADDTMDVSTTAAADASTDASVGGSGSTGAQGDSSGSSSSSSSGSAESDPTASTMGDGSASSTGGETPFELCQGPCEANAMCGGESDHCVELTEGNAVCLRACNRGCPDGFTCQMRVSVEGTSDLQCVPDGNICP